MGKIKETFTKARLKLKSMPAESGNKAFVRVLQFFAIMLVLTIFARGAAGVTMPRVEATTTSSGEISDIVEERGSVVAQGNLEINVPEGMTVSKVNAAQGTSVKAGDTLLEFDTDELRRTLATERANLSELNLQLRELQETDGVSTAGLESAQKAVDSAQRTYDTTYSEYQPLKAIFDAKYATEQALLAQDPEKLQQATIDAVVEAAEAWTALAPIEAELNTARTALDDARSAQTQAQKEYDKAVEKQVIADERNKIAIEKKRLEIEVQQELVRTLEQSQSAGGALTTPSAGYVSETPYKAGDITQKDTKIRLVTGDEGYVVEIRVSQENANKLQVGNTLNVKRQNAWYASEATIVSKFYSSTTNSMMVRASLPGTDWTEGETLEATLVLSRRNYYSCVPISAVRSDANGGYYVYTLEERKTVLGTQLVAVKQSVTIEAQDTEKVAIQGTFNYYDALILTSSSKPVNEGDRVRLEDAVNGV